MSLFKNNNNNNLGRIYGCLCAVCGLKTYKWKSYMNGYTLNSWKYLNFNPFLVQ